MSHLEEDREPDETERTAEAGVRKAIAAGDYELARDLMDLLDRYRRDIRTLNE